MPSQFFFADRKPSSIALLELDSPMPPWQVAMITRAKPELSAVSLAFVQDVGRVAAGLGPAKKPVRSPQA